MCGIAGAINLKLNWNEVQESLYHRGPDCQNIVNLDNITLLHTRLSIQDILNGSQPFVYENFSLVFNGEIYNHLELRDKLPEISFKTNSDTETLLHLYIKYRNNMFQMIDGMFAFAIYDRNTNKLFMARDRAGKKPLFYYFNEKEKSFFFASELNAFCFNKTINHDSLAGYLKMGFFIENNTPYENIFQLEAGTSLELDLDSFLIKKHKYFSIENYYNNQIDYSLNEAVELLEEKLINSVKSRLFSSDLEVGAFLSGGIDSSLIVAIASKYKRLNTFTVSFNGAFDESDLAKLTAEKYNTNHHEIKISMNLKNDIEKILTNYGMPFFDSSAIPSYYVSQEAKKYLTVILNGDGADELFAGYRRYVPVANNNLNMISNFSFLSNLMSPSNSKQTLYNYFYRLLKMSDKKNGNLYLSATNDIFEDTYAIYSKTFDNFNENIKNIFSRNVSELSKFLIADFNILLFQDLLVKMDIATMSNSIEGRSPFLSKELLEFAPTLNDNLKINGTKTKYILRELSKKYLSETLVTQPKRGFEIPLKDKIDGELKEIVFDNILSRSILDNFIDRVFREDLLDNKVNVSSEKRAKMIWAMFTLAIWHRNLKEYHV